jgi:hypothetical protein
MAATPAQEPAMVRSARHAIVLLALAAPIGVSASPTIDAASTCLTDRTTGRDRKDLVEWIFLAIARHPEIRALSAASPEAMDQSDRRIGALFTRLVAEDCPAEFRAMLAEHGPSSMAKAFEVLGRVAMTELMGHPDVAGALSGLERHADLAKIEAALEEQ